MHEASQSLIHQVSDSDPSKLKDTAHTEGWRLNPLFIRSQIQIDDCRFECNHLQTSQSLIHQVSDSDVLRTFSVIYGNGCLNPLFIRSQIQMRLIHK